MQQQQKAPTLFNREVKNFSNVVEELTYSDVVRTLFFTRITSIHLRALTRSQVLKENIRHILYATLDSLRRYDHTMLGNIGGEREKILNQELKKDKVYDIGNLVDSIVSITEKDSGIGSYESHLSFVTSWMETVANLQKNKKKLNTKKYKALMEFMLEEMKAESEGGVTSVSYDEASNELHFKLVQPNSNIGVHPTI